MNLVPISDDSDDKLNDTKKFAGLMSPTAYKRKREEVLMEVAREYPHIKGMAKQVKKNEEDHFAKDVEERKAREDAKKLKLKASLDAKLDDDNDTAEKGENSDRAAKKSRKKKKKAAAAAAATRGLSFE
uniref:Uncharacterized protein n=1 Tax=Octactis speculum TaxID=3111310 RepID=A0A7S2C301_9STRA|mmetsp:Transcript_31073/g.42101  ORF Transcript_31073/g.42101 Transcript_31073/m.42101 type:complete len:129 (+) Transcript_31073:59-445(+)